MLIRLKPDETSWFFKIFLIMSCVIFAKVFFEMRMRSKQTIQNDDIDDYSNQILDWNKKIRLAILKTGTYAP